MKHELYRGYRVALLIPCYNEELSIEQVIQGFKKVIPEAVIYVFDNNSTDETSNVARAAGAIVKFVQLKGKGNVVCRMFADVEADIYIMVDGDNTYDAGSVYLLVNKLIDEELDMVVGCRVEEKYDKANYRPGHRLGNRILTQSVMKIFGGTFTDMLSGYRVFSRRFVKSFPALSSGFEIETELTVYTLGLRMQYGEVATPYSARIEGSSSKLSTYKDGWKILKTIVKLYMNERPLKFFGIIGIVLIFSSLVLGGSVIIEFLKTHLVARFPTAILAGYTMLAGLISVAAGFILNTVTRGRYEKKRLHYLSIPGISREP